MRLNVYKEPQAKSARIFPGHDGALLVPILLNLFKIPVNAKYVRSCPALSLYLDSTYPKPLNLV
jgi:hypothetical protein